MAEGPIRKRLKPEQIWRNSVFLEPFNHLWKREIVSRKGSTRKDVYYISPNNTKLSSRNDAIRYFQIAEDQILTPDNFNFQPFPIGPRNGEIERVADGEREANVQEEPPKPDIEARIQVLEKFMEEMDGAVKLIQEQLKIK